VVGEPVLSDHLLPITMTDPFVHVCDTATGKEIGALAVDGKDNRVWSISFSPDGKLLASSGWSDGIRVWNLATRKEVHRIDGVQSSRLAFSPNGGLMAFSSHQQNNLENQMICLWDTAAGTELRRWDCQQWRVDGLVFSPDGMSLASSAFGILGLKDSRAEISVWSTGTGKQLMRFSGEVADPWGQNTTKILSLTYSPTSRILAVAVSRQSAPNGERDYSCVIHLFEVLSGQEIRRINAPQGAVHALAFAPDGRTLASGGVDSTILLWDVTGRAQNGKLMPNSLSTTDLEQLWSDLAADAAKADRTIWTLASAPRQSVAMLKQRLLVAPAPAEQVAKLLADLDSDRFAGREKAAQALDALGDTAEAAIRKVVANNPTLEMRRRLEPILANRDKAALRPLRAIDALEQARTAEARQVLEALATEAANPRVGEAAAAALKRLANHSQ
jgi:hypothetical protein